MATAKTKKTDKPVNKKKTDKPVNEKQEQKVILKPKLRTRLSSHYDPVWFKNDDVKLTVSKNDKEFYLLTISGNQIVVGVKAKAYDSKDGKQTAFNIQNSREYRVFGTSESLLGKDIIQYSIQLNQFNKQQKELTKFDKDTGEIVK